MIFYRGCCVGLTLLNVKDTAFHPIRSFRRVSVKCHEFDTRRRYPMQQPLLICSFFSNIPSFNVLRYSLFHFLIFQFKRMLNKELSHFSESKSGSNQISEYICSTFLGKENLFIPSFENIFLTYYIHFFAV